MARRTQRSRPAPGLFDGLGAEGGGEAGRRAARESMRREPAPREEGPAPAGPEVLKVGELTELLKGRLESLGRLRVEGELSSLRRPASGHVYFDLKDEGARLACAIWRSRTSRALPFEPEEGMQVVAHGKLDVYAPRGSYSLIVERLEPLGIGALLAQLERTKAELAARGWFERRRPLPGFPEPVGVVTSRDGAAFQDFLRTRSLRWPGYPVRLVHTAVQGPGAAADIAAAIRRLEASGVSVIVVCRGGGSLEDLWSFNELAVAEAIWSSSVPVVCGVGHETDTTLADLVADHRAHTPTDAAQTVLPDRGALCAELARQGNYLIEAADALVERRAERLAALAGRPALRDPAWILGQRQERLGHLARRLEGEVRGRLERGRASLSELLTRLERRSPRASLEAWTRRFERASTRLAPLGPRLVERAEERLAADARALESVSPLRVLGRGYSLARKAGETAPLVDAAELAPGDRIETRLARGSVLSEVVSTEPEEQDPAGEDGA